MTAWRPAVGWAGVLALAGIVLLRSGGSLAPPDVGAPDTWGAWLDGAGSLVAAFAVVRLLAVAVWCYLLAATLVGIVLRVLHARTLLALADRLTVPSLRRLLVTTVAGLTLGSGPASLAWAQETGPSDRPTTTRSLPSEAEVPPMTLRGLPARGTATDGRADEVPPAPASPAERPPSAASDTSWTVVPGESFWSRAQQHVTALRTADGEPSEAEVARYWLRLIEANRSALADRANPDLIFPGQQFVLP